MLAQQKTITSENANGVHQDFRRLWKLLANDIRHVDFEKKNWHRQCVADA